MMHPSISIVTPAYNTGDLLLETYHSLEKQTFKNFEWIIVDDNSDEYDEQLIKAIKNKASFSVQIIRNSTNLRQAKSKNIGLKHSSGKYIKFLDADDLLDERHLENQFNLMERQIDGFCAIFSPTVNFVNEISNCVKNDSYKSVRQNNFCQLERFLVYPFFSHCGCLFHKDSIENIKGFDESLITDEDGDFILRLMLSGIIFVPEEKSGYYYRRHDFNARVSANDSDEKWLARLDVCLKIEDMLNGKYESLKEALAQRLDVIGLSCMEYSEEHAKEFFEHAKRIYPNYSIPGNTMPKIVRSLFGNHGYQKVKKILGKR